MNEKTKNLTNKGVVKLGLFSRNNRINDITKKLKIIKSYKLQLEKLGFIVNGNSLYDTKELHRIINAQINRSLPSHSTEKLNKLNFACCILIKGNCSSDAYFKYTKVLKYLENNESFNSVGEGLEVALLRLLKKAKRKGVVFKIEKSKHM